VLLALLLERTGSLYPGIVAHAYLNVPVLELFVPSLTWPAIAIVLVALVVAVAVSVNDDRRKTLRSRGSRPHDPAAAEAALRAQLARRHAEASGHPRPW